MNLTAGLCVLDLACGTGPITIPAAKAVGSSGKVIGIDISGDSLIIAREKARKEGLENVEFYLHDIAALEGLQGKGVEEASFDIIACASALPLIESPGTAVKSWAKFLKLGGKLIFDVPTYNALIGGWVMNLAFQKLGIAMAYNWNNEKALENIKKMLKGAGLDDRETFVTESYDGAVIEVKSAGELFEKTVGKEWYDGIYSKLTEPGRKEEAKKLFCGEVERLAGEDREVMEDRRFAIAIGKRVGE